MTPIKSEQGLFVSVARLTRELHDAMQELRMDERLASLAGSEIPDACSRLDYVVKVTEEAAHRTLDLVEHGRELTMQIETCVQSLGQACEREQTGAGSRHTQSRLVASVDELGAQIVATNEQLRGTLSQLAQAQEYQDLAGQVIKRVTQLVRSVERALIDLLRAAGTQVGAGQTVRESPVGGLHGPAIAGLTPAAVSQDDADSLLAELGF
ncbi:MAG: protein phosphatase CheZ [Panacagrimonas sp.]